jgi:hypothetical protein
MEDLFLLIRPEDSQPRLVKKSGRPFQGAGTVFDAPGMVHVTCYVEDCRASEVFPVRHGLDQLSPATSTDIEALMDARAEGRQPTGRV